MVAPKGSIYNMFIICWWIDIIYFSPSLLGT